MLRRLFRLVRIWASEADGSGMTNSRGPVVRANPRAIMTQVQIQS